VQVVIETDAGHAGTAAAYLLASIVAGLAAAVPRMNATRGTPE
jgi:hypothetical protein